MKTFNITASVYDKSDISRQTILINEIISASCELDARIVFAQQLETKYQLVKIYSAEEFSKVAS